MQQFNKFNTIVVRRVFYLKIIYLISEMGSAKYLEPLPPPRQEPSALKVIRTSTAHIVGKKYTVINGCMIEI